MAVTTANEGQPFFTAVWVYDSSGAAYIDNTIEARLDNGTAFTIFDATADFLYMGAESRVDLVAFILSTKASLGTGSLKWEYASSATAWTQFVPSFSYDFSLHGAESWAVRNQLQSWTSRTFTTSTPHSVSSVPDGDERYWIRVSSSSITTSPTVTRLHARPYAAYCSPTDVANILQLTSDFSSSTTPSRITVENYIAAAQSRIDFYTRKSWRVNWRQNEYHEFNTAGFKLAKIGAFQVTANQVWNGTNFVTRDEGRSKDYFLVPEINMVYWSRFFLLPARFQTASSSLTWWGFGEFVLPVRISYLYGLDLYAHEQGGDAYDLAKKMAAIDVYESHDYSILIVSGTDKVPLEQKINHWKEEIEHKMESLKAWEVF
jgi:hypothetical protein